MSIRSTSTSLRQPNLHPFHMLPRPVMLVLAFHIHLDSGFLILERMIIFIDWSTRRMIGIECESQGLFHFSSPSSSSVCASMDTPFLIQNRLGHQNISKFRKMVPHFSSLSSIECESCQFGKHTRVSFLGRLDQWTKSHFELVHTDVWGPSWTESTSGFLYFVIFINDYSRYTWIFLMKAQAELFSIF